MAPWTEWGLSPQVTSANSVNECKSAPCQNGGACVDLLDAYGCNCLAGFEGDNCAQVASAVCPVDNDCDAVHVACCLFAFGAQADYTYLV
jgi:Notch-like protein